MLRFPVLARASESSVTERPRVREPTIDSGSTRPLVTQLLPGWARRMEME